MQPFVQSIYPELTELGGFRALEGHLDETSYELGGMKFETPEGMDYSLTLTHTGEAILLQGTLSTTAYTECARCLSEAVVDIKGEVLGYYLLTPEEAEEGYEPDEVEVIDAKGDFDLAACLQAALSYSTPQVVLCKDDCKGLCPRCGADLNVETCNCNEEPDPTNPFAALLGLSFSDEDAARGEAAALEHEDDEPLVFEEEEEQLSPEEEAELEKALDAIFGEGAEGTLEFDDEGNLIFIPAEDIDDEE